MTNNDYNQLRFDISENVRLHPQQSEIGTLLSLDLYPDVEIKDNGNHLKIEGFLRLKGTYLTEQKDEQEEMLSEPQEELSYIIPVEISLPADRAERNLISAEVESFDYDVLSPFELQIDAILMIDGLLPEPQAEEETVEQDQNVLMFSGSQGRIETSEEQNESIEATASAYQNQEEAEKKKDVEEAQEMDISSVKAELIQEEELQSTTELEVETELQEEIDDEPETEETTMQNEEDGNKSQDWASWLVSQEKEEDFTSLRLVIAQAGESIHHIAEKYSISTQEIIRLNRLEDEHLEPGQIIYIPKQEAAQS